MKNCHKAAENAKINAVLNTRKNCSYQAKVLEYEIDLNIFGLLT